MIALPRGRWYRDIRGERRGRLLVVEPTTDRASGAVVWLCLCDCGREVLKSSRTLLRPTGAKSCGCLLRESARQRGRAVGGANRGSTYAIANGEHVYTTKHAWGKAVRRARGSSCETCGWSKARCDVHHRVARSNGGKNTISNGVVLCPNCHRVEHERRRHAQH